jgi:hypothetical protein
MQHPQANDDARLRMVPEFIPIVDRLEGLFHESIPSKHSSNAYASEPNSISCSALPAGTIG